MFFEVENVSKGFGGRRVLKDVTLAVNRGECVSIVGPSGVGKTTLLSLIAGLETPDAGEIRFAAPPSRDNPVILVFQDYLLFPGMTVAENIAFGLAARRLSRQSIRARVADMLGYFQLEDKAENYPAHLSAGQKQRVAIARAMVVEPSILLLDEPFANLDRNLKMDTAAFIRRTQQEFGVTTVSVTHDLEEAFAMSDRMGILIDGRLIQYDSVSAIYNTPSSFEAARFLGPVNRIPVELLVHFGLAPEAIGESELVTRPEAISIHPSSQGNGRVEEKVFVGHYIVYKVRLEGERFTVYSLEDGIAPGDRVLLSLRKHSEAHRIPQ